jgi:hypothetical protein
MFVEFRAERASQMRIKGHGEYTDIVDGKQFLDIITNTKQTVCHFYKKEFKRCIIVDRHLKTLSKIYFKTRWLKFDVEKAGFFVEKFKIRILPCIVVFLNGIVRDSIIGFEELGGVDTFCTATLVKRLSKSGVITFEEESLSQIMLEKIDNSTSNDEED